MWILEGILLNQSIKPCKIFYTWYKFGLAMHHTHSFTLIYDMWSKHLCVIFNDISTRSYLIVYKDVPKLVHIITKVLHVIRKINNHKTTKSFLKTNLIKSLQKSFPMSIKYNIVCGIVFVRIHCIWVIFMHVAMCIYVFQEFYNSKWQSDFCKACAQDFWNLCWESASS